MPWNKGPYMPASSARLLPLEALAHVFEPLSGKRVGYIRPCGNVGDALIDWAARQLLDAFHIDWSIRDPDAESRERFDELVFGGGGNMGPRYQDNWQLRTRVLALGLPVTILPQSFTSPEERPYRRVYVRERVSMAFCPQGILAPDLALGLKAQGHKVVVYTLNSSVDRMIAIEGAGRIGETSFAPGQVWYIPAGAEPFALSAAAGRAVFIRTYVPS